MANYECRARSSYFRVTDEKKLRELVKKVGAELWAEMINGEEHFAFGQYGPITEYPDENEPDGLHDITSELQKIIPDDEVIVIQEIGHEKLAYIQAWSVIITKQTIEVIDLPRITLERAKELSGKKYIQLTY